MDRTANPLTRWAGRWRYAAFGACLAQLGVAAGMHSDLGATAGAAAAIGGVLAATGLGAVRARAELSDDDRRAPLAEAVALAIRAGGPVWLGLAAVYGAMLTWRLNGGHVSVVVVAAAALALVAGVAVGILAALRSDGVDRAVMLRSAAYSFWLTMAAAVGYALFESLGPAPRVSMWVVWAFGGGTWGVASMVVRRRMS